MRDTADRRNQILLVLCERRSEKINNLAQEFGVSERTIRRDIETLSLSAPLETSTGIYGGVKVLYGYSVNRFYLSGEQKELVKRLAAPGVGEVRITEDDRQILNDILKKFSKPELENVKHENRNKINNGAM